MEAIICYIFYTRWVRFFKQSFFNQLNIMRNKVNSHSRRNFMKISAAGAAGAFMGGMSSEVRAAEQAAGQATIWQDGMQINPNIDNLRVVLCHDPTMVESNPLLWTMEGQNDPVVEERVYANMDQMAIALADRGVQNPDDTAANAEAAWETIFQKPADKDWQDVNVAIKINSVQSDWPRLAVINKICMALNSLGVPIGNMCIYDAGDLNWGYHHIEFFQTDYCRQRLPEGIQITDILGADLDPGLDLDQRLEQGTEPISLLGQSFDCVAGLTNDSTDILINIAVNKGHRFQYVGGFTLTMKNHLGSLRFGHGSTVEESIEFYEAMAKSNAILGTGLPPRQQLNVIDSIWGFVGGPSGEPDTATRCLIMGTFSPIVDYLTVKKIRDAPTEGNGGPPYGMGVTDTVQEVVEHFVTDFGYTLESDEIQNLDFVNAMAYQSPVGTKEKKHQHYPGREHIKVLTVSTISRRPSTAAFSLPVSGTSPVIEIYDIKGNLVRTLRAKRQGSGNFSAAWNGRSSRGVAMNPGTYLVKVTCGRMVKADNLFLMP
ncbi:FlgD immunoglobulin-like domain containing protein [Fibrobacterota bacterium]